jgi:LPS sulfotransferase NodH
MRFFRFQVNRFVILFVERAGSTYLMSLLNSHPEIRCVTEKLDTIKQSGKGAQAQLEWTRDFLTPPFLGQNRAIGFKTKEVDILDPEGFKEILTRNKTRIIQLQRKNSVKAVISTMNAKRLHDAAGSWNLLKESDRRPPMEVDLDEFESLLQVRETWDRGLETYIRNLNLPTISLFYEDLLQDEASFISSIFDFLGVDPHPVQGKTIKHTKDDLREVILNFDQLRSKYLDTKYGPMFDEVLVTESTQS